DHYPDQPGEFQLCGSEGVIKRLVFGCPLRPGHACMVPLKPNLTRGGASWDWDGNLEAPTLTPSIHCLSEYQGQPSAGCGWHGYIRGGKPVSA
ncbi:MAG TPA: DUF6527 family protein, partial [Gemmatimonadaceae bacterium]|nr:DUF6527 family protein [Gemmatimonadaceae bacterium]